MNLIRMLRTKRERSKSNNNIKAKEKSIAGMDNNNNQIADTIINNKNNSDLAIKWEMYKALQPGYLRGVLSHKQEETYKALSKELGMS